MAAMVTRMAAETTDTPTEVGATDIPMAEMEEAMVGKQHFYIYSGSQLTSLRLGIVRRPIGF